MPTTLTNGIQLPDKGSVDWYSSMESNYNLIDTHLGDTDVHVTAEDKANWDSKQGSLSQAQLDAIAQVDINTNDIATLQSDKADASHTHSSTDITDIDDYATKDYVDNSISDLVDNAPDALNTLNELSAALNDDSNFASTVTTALATKVNSADLATVATTGDYDDLSNKPSIPTNTSDLTNDSGFITSSDVPTSTSDLINDSNFVDTSNSAVSSGITSTKVTDYDTHIADTDIHVTTTDKNKWNNQTYVFRYSSTALTASSTNSNALLDNTDNLKVGDKVIDSSGVLFSITAIDTANSTFTIGTALIDLANDSDVVHKSGDETVGGVKTFNNDVTVNNPSASVQADVPNLMFKNPLVERGSTTLDGEQAILFTDKNASNIASIQAKTYTSGTSDIILTSYSETSDQSVRTTGIVIRRTPTTSKFHGYSDNITSLGDTNRRWSKVYATSYYYGANNVEFSDKFVTTDTAQTISGAKTFNDLHIISYGTQYKGSRNAYILPEFAAGYSGLSIATLSYSQTLKIGNFVLDANNKPTLDTSKGYIQIATGENNNVNTCVLEPRNSTSSSLGTSSNKWSKINGVEPSSLSLPSGNLNDVIDISSYITDLRGYPNDYVAPSNGFISISATGTGINMFIDGIPLGVSLNRSTSGSIKHYIPILKNQTAKILVIASSLEYVKFIPCQGNV